MEGQRHAPGGRAAVADGDCVIHHAIGLLPVDGVPKGFGGSGVPLDSKGFEQVIPVFGHLRQLRPGGLKGLIALVIVEGVGHDQALAVVIGAVDPRP